MRDGLRDQEPTGRSTGLQTSSEAKKGVQLERTNAGEDRVAFNEECEYPDGTRVLCAAMLDVHGGKIMRQTNVDAWDE